MFEAERIEDWIGVDVIGPDGEKVGKLEDVFTRSETDDSAAIGAIKTGAFGRKHRLVPFEGATVGRDYVRVRYDADRVKDSPEIDEDGRISAAEASGLFGHYGLDRSATGSGEYEAASSRNERRAEVDAANERAAELEAQAQEDAETARSQKDSADQAERRRVEALEEAERLRAEAAQRER